LVHHDLVKLCILKYRERVIGMAIVVNVTLVSPSPNLIFMKKTLKGLAVLFPALLFFPGKPCHAQEQREDWISKSSLIFKAEILLTNTSTIDWPDPSNLAVVRLQDVIKGEQSLASFLKEPVTVRFLNMRDVMKGQVMIIYGDVWVSGESIAIAETGHELMGENKLTNDNYLSEIRVSVQKAEARELKANAAKAELVIAGTVVALRKEKSDRSFLTEHDPEWMLAEIKVDENLKGNSSPGATVIVAFPTSQDFMWYQSPRLREGEKAIFFLSRENFGYQQVKQFTITTRDQVRDVRDLDFLKQSLR
jgi:hypothetical protein